MSLIEKQIIVDLWQKLLQPITVVQCEASGRKLAISLTSAGLPVNLTACDVVFYAQKPDNTILFNDCDVIDAASGSIEYTITEQTVVAAGVLNCWIVVTKTGATVRSQRFNLTVQESPDFTGAVESTSEFSDLEVALAIIAGFDARLTTAEGEIDTLQTDLTAAEGDIDDLEADKATLQSCRARAYLSANNQENLVHGTATKVILDGEEYDPGDNFNTSTYRFTAPVDGYYLINGSVLFTNVVADRYYMAIIYVYGTDVARNYIHASLTSFACAAVTTMQYLSAGQYIELYAQSNAGDNTVDILRGSKYTFLEVALMAAA